MPTTGAQAPRHHGAAPRLLTLHPLTQGYEVEVDAGERRELSALAARVLAREPGLNNLSPFGTDVEAGLGPWPCLCIEDHSEITLFERSGNVLYGHRSLLLARDGDLAMMSNQRSPTFEAYCRETLGLGDVEVLSPGTPEDRPVAARCVADQALLDLVAERARRSGGLNIMPYMGTGETWRLAAAIAARARATVRVAAPPPRLVRRANDKIWFARLVTEVLGDRALPPGVATHGPAALADRVARLAKDHTQVAVKLPSSASAEGNVVFDAQRIQSLGLRALRDEVLAALRRTGWDGDFPLMVMAWEQPLLASPSTQLWIPDRDHGPPMIEAIFDQTLIGPRHVFGGAEPTGLAEAWQQRIADEAARLGHVFQDLGYFGRCSLDAILVGSSAAKARLHWIECNGRWGGVSLPLTLANRLTGDWRRHALVIAERGGLEMPQRGLAEVLKSLQDSLFVAGRRSGGAVILSPGAIETGRGFEIMAIADSLPAAKAEAHDVARRLMSTRAPD